jgi:hypothetical protein
LLVHSHRKEQDLGREEDIGWKQRPIPGYH